jgi:hypothetical protein
MKRQSQRHPAAKVKLTERFFIPTPAPTGRTETVKYPDGTGRDFPIYLDAHETPMKWSGDFPIPAVGSRVFITMNGIGWAFVVGFFESCGYVGLMTKPINPPQWLRDQQKRELKEDRMRQPSERCLNGNGTVSAAPSGRSVN